MLKPFLELLNYMPDRIINIGITGETILNEKIISNPDIQDKLRRI
jgi:hypothetical protein